jgi:hypothetical protein
VLGFGEAGLGRSQIPPDFARIGRILPELSGLGRNQIPPDFARILSRDPDGRSVVAYATRTLLPNKFSPWRTYDSTVWGGIAAFLKGCDFVATPTLLNGYTILLAGHRFSEQAH